jgi:hypothetical protein
MGKAEEADVMVRSSQLPINFRINSRHFLHSTLAIVGQCKQNLIITSFGSEIDLHVYWSRTFRVNSGVALYLYSPNKIIRTIALFYPVLILLVIMATANHYLLDAVGGFFVTVLAYKINTVLLNLRPLEEWGFFICGVDKPIDGELFQRLLAEQSTAKYLEQEQGLLQLTHSPNLSA